MPPTKRKTVRSQTDSASSVPTKKARRLKPGSVAKQDDESEGHVALDKKKRASLHRDTARGSPYRSLDAMGIHKQDESVGPEESLAKDLGDANRRYTTGKNNRQYWLMKAEPESRLERGVDVKFSIDDLKAATEPEPWDGIRNYVARNHMRAMRKGDYAFFYHSNCKVPGIVGYMEIVREHSVDESAFDSAHPYYDAKSKRDSPKWSVVHVEFRCKFSQIITLNDLKSHAVGGPLQDLQTLNQSRLSVSPVTPQQWEYIMKLAEGADN